jgi:hypothetical protein
MFLGHVERYGQLLEVIEPEDMEVAPTLFEFAEKRFDSVDGMKELKSI